MNAPKKKAPQAQLKAQLPLFNFRGAAPAGKPFPGGGLLIRGWQWLCERFAAKVSGRRLQVTATVPLGEKRFVAVVKVDGREFLVGGGATNVALLASLDGQVTEFSELLGRSVVQQAAKPAAKTRKQTTRPAVEPVAAAKRKSKPAAVAQKKIDRMPAAKKKISAASVVVKKIAASQVKHSVKESASRAVRMPQWTAQLNVAPALGHFIKPQLKGVAVKPGTRQAVAAKKTSSKSRKSA